MITRRLFLLRSAIALAGAALVGQLYRLQVLESKTYQTRADQNRIRTRYTPALRGVIYDRIGRLLVRNLPSFTIGIIPADLPTPRQPAAKAAGVTQAAAASTSRSPFQRGGQARTAEEVFTYLGRILHMNPSEIAQRVEQGSSSPFTPVVLRSNVEREVALVIEENRRDLPGVIVQTETIREYISGPILSHIIGYISRITKDEYEQAIRQTRRDDVVDINDLVGRMGLELTMEPLLRGRKGQSWVEVDAAGRLVRTIFTISDQRPGNSLILTIDQELQRRATDALQKGMAESGARGGAVVILQPKTGEVLALVSLPSYDNNLFAGQISEENWERLIKDPARPLFNRAIGGMYPPGSTLKVITAAAGLQDGIVDLSTRLTCRGTIVVPSQFDPLTKYTFYCWLREGHGVIGLTEAIAQSCDIYFYHVGGGFESFQGLGVDRLTHYLRSFGLGRETGIDLPGEATGLVPDNLWKLRQPWNTRGEPWLTGDTYNLAIGQGFGLATPLQMANVTAAIANGGTLYRPQLVLQVVDAEGRVIRGFQPEVIGQLPISQKNLERVKDGMRAAVTHGTATACNFPDLEVAGKTGTAEFGEVDAKGNRPSHAWYISFAPFSNPTVAMVVFVEGGGNGAKIAVPIAARIYQYLFNQPELPSAPEHGE